MDAVTDVRLGREIVAQGKLQSLREQLHLTRSAMAELLHTSVFTYSSWESKPHTQIWPTTASRIGRFYESAVHQLQLLAEDGISMEELVPLHIAASTLGVPQELLFKWCREEKLETADLGVLGLWIYRDNIDYLNK